MTNKSTDIPRTDDCTYCGAARNFHSIIYYKCHSSPTQRSSLCIARERADKAEAEVEMLRKKSCKWKEAVIEELDSIGIYTEEWAKDPKKALHHIACWHTEVGMHYERENKWTNRLRVKLEYYWYKTVWKLFKIQPPF